jgi:polygalacturonase
MSMRITIALLLIAGASLRAQDQRHVAEPVIPPVCASLAAVNSWPLHEDSPDTARIQAALDHCAPGRAF